MITVSSTTDTQEALQTAVDHGLKTVQPKAAAPAEVETGEHPEVDETETGAASETAHTKEDESEPPEEEEEPKEEEEEPEEEERPVGKTRRKLLRRLSRLHSENLTLQEKLEEAERKLRGDKPQAEAAVSQAKPNPKDFKSYEDYIEALADWKIAERDRQRAKAAQDEFVKTILEDYNAQVEHARETHDDFDESVNSSAQIPVIAINAMYELENGAEVAYYLAKHQEVREQLLEWNEPGVRGGVRKILATLDHISEELGNKPSSASRSNGGSAPVRQRPQSAAPAPIRPVGSGASTRSSADPGKMPYQDYVRWYQQKYGKRR